MLSVRQSMLSNESNAIYWIRNKNQEWRMVKPSEPCYEDIFEITENVYINLKYLCNLLFSLAMHLEMLVYRRCRWRRKIRNQK